MRELNYVPGKIDYHGSGRRNCEAEFTWTLENGRFSMQAAIWNTRRTHCYICGQCVDDVAAYFPDDAKVQRMAFIWRRWHLNDMRAGSPAQSAWLIENPQTGYEATKAALAAAGLQPDPETGYSYGSDRLTEELPADVIAEIQSWSAAQSKPALPKA